MGPSTGPLSNERKAPRECFPESSAADTDYASQGPVPDSESDGGALTAAASAKAKSARDKKAAMEKKEVAATDFVRPSKGGGKHPTKAATKEILKKQLKQSTLISGSTKVQVTSCKSTGQIIDKTKVIFHIGKAWF